MGKDNNTAEENPSVEKNPEGRNKFSNMFSVIKKSKKNNDGSSDKDKWIKKHKLMEKKLVTSLNDKKIPTYRQFKYLPRYFTKKESTIVQIALTVFIISFLFVLVRVYQTVTHVVPQSGGKYTEALVGSPKYINPILSQTNDTDMDIARLVFSGLLKIDSDLKLVNDLAEKYEISEDQKEYTVYLRKDLKFHDGQDLNADDVLFTFESIQDTSYRSPLYLNFSGVGLQRIDDYTVKFVLQEPFTPFLSSLTFGILPEHIWAEISPESAYLAEYNLKPIGSGPFQFNNYTKDKNGNIKSYELKKFESFYDNKPYLDQITFKFYPDPISAMDAAKNKNVDGVSFVANEYKEELQKRNGNIEYHSLRLPQYAAVFFNQKNELLKTKTVREALAYAVDKQSILQNALNGEGEIINGPILPGYVGYNPEIRKYEFNLDEARRILEEDGWKYPDAVDGEPAPTVRVKDGAELAFAISTINSSEYLATLTIIKQAWESIGVRLEVKEYSTKDIQKRVIKPRAYEALLFGEIVGTDPDPYPFWHSSQSRDPGLNLAVFYNKDIDQLLEEARKTNDEEQRRLKYLHFQNILADEIPAIFLYNPVYTYGLDEKVKGLEGQYISVPSDRFSGILNWFIKTNRRWGKES
ncbi:MAG: ABC transporter substrate-binding protein [Patescibacteria group bacterium]